MFATPPKTEEEARQMLEDNGWHQVGNGYFATVFGKAGRDDVIKVGGRGDRDGWVPFAKFCMTDEAKANPHLPNVHAVAEHDGFYVARMERLEEAPAPEDDPAVDDLRNSSLAVLNHGDSSTTRNNKLAAFQVAYPKLWRAAAQIHIRFARDWDIDLHRYNVMVRRAPDGTATMVLNDPISFRAEQ